MNLIPDWDLERWARIYRANRIDLRMPGLTFAAFVQTPNAYLIMAIFREPQVFADDALDCFPLLPEQEVVALAQVYREGLEEACQALEARLPTTAVYRGDHYIEPLHHRSFPR